MKYRVPFFFNELPVGYGEFLFYCQEIQDADTMKPEPVPPKSPLRLAMVRSTCPGVITSGELNAGGDKLPSSVKLVIEHFTRAYISCRRFFCKIAKKPAPHFSMEYCSITNA
jgi:hypothetical protein